jgi:hypothetical protein
LPARRHGCGSQRARIFVHHLREDQQALASLAGGLAFFQC